MKNETQQSNVTELLASKQSKFRWTSGSDVQQVWRRYGWVPPTEVREDFLFAKNREIGKTHD
jgi:hypothetical protein